MRYQYSSFATVTLAGILLLGVAGCSAGSEADGGNTAAPAQEQLSGKVTVFAAASLKGTFTELAADFEEAHPGTEVALNFAGSSDLVTQLTEGAPADVFASADTKNMDKLSDAGLVEGTPVDFATNFLTIAVPKGNPAAVSSLADLAAADTKVVVCAPQVPCGAATDKVEEAAGVTLGPVSEESSVTDVLGKVTSGEADAGLVYVTDVMAAGDSVDGVAFEESGAAVNTYPISRVKDGSNPAAAEAFIELVTSGQGQDALSAAGFGAP